MRVRIDTLAAKLGCAASESAVRASLAGAEETDHAAFMAEHFPTVVARLTVAPTASATNDPASPNGKRAAMDAFTERTRLDPFDRPDSPRPVTIGPGSRGVDVVTPLPGLGRVRATGDPANDSYSARQLDALNRNRASGVRSPGRRGPGY